VPLIGCEFYVELDGLRCRREVLSRSITVQRGATRYKVDLPDGPDAFRFDRVGTPRIRGKAPDPRDYEPTVALVEQGGPDLVDVRLIKITANVDSSLSAASFDIERSEDQESPDRVLADLYSGALQLARDLCDWVRLTLEQYWIEPSGRYSRVVNAIAPYDLTADRSFGFMIARRGCCV
jgi:hypothetical protein